LKEIQGYGSERLVRALDREIRSRGHGAIRAVGRALGYGGGWWQHRVASGDIGVRQMLGVLDHLGLDPVKFVRRTLGEEESLELDRPRGEPPEIVARAWERLYSEAEVTGVGTAYLETLDRQRYREPEEVVTMATWAIDHVELELLPRLLGVAGSAYRLSIRLEESAHAIHTGVEIAESQNDQSAVGNLLQRLSYVVADRGDRHEALRLAERAAMIFLRLGDHQAFGEALVAQGTWLFYLERFEEAIGTQEAALDHVDSSALRHRCAAFQIMGLAHQQLGLLNAALDNFGAAQEAAKGIEDWARGKIIWLRARIHADLEQLEQAAELFKEVVEIFCGLHHGETTLATCELVRIQLLQGQPETAYSTATTMRALLEPIRSNQIISAAIGDLLRCGRAGLTLALLKRVEAQIENERQRDQAWRSLQVRPPR